MSEALANDVANLIEQCLKKDKEIERLNKEILGLNNCIIEFHSEFCNKQSEINRLNNIINELEKFINTKVDYIDFVVDPILDKLQELKGSVKAIPPEVIGTNGEDGGLFDYGDKGE